MDRCLLIFDCARQVVHIVHKGKMPSCIRDRFAAIRNDPAKVRCVEVPAHRLAAEKELMRKEGVRYVEHGKPEPVVYATHDPRMVAYMN